MFSYFSGREEAMIPEGFTQQEWQEFVRRGKELVQQDNNQAWAWGDLANEIVPSIGTTANTGGALEAFAEAIGYEGEISTLRNRRAVAAAYPLVIRITSVPWSVHQILMGLEDRAEVIKSRDDWTAARARAFIENRKAVEQTEAVLQLELATSIDEMDTEVTRAVRKFTEGRATLTLPIFEANKTHILERLHHVRETVDLLISMVEGTNESMDDALERMLSES
jgi:hypothetical protein